MVASLGLTLYHLATRRETRPNGLWPARPNGRLIWLHAPSIDATKAMAELARRIAEEDGHPVLITSATTPIGPALHIPPPGDSYAESKAFLDHWKPDAILMADGEIRPSVLQEAAERRIPMALVNGRAPAIFRDRDGWYPGLLRGSLALFQQVLAVDEAAARAFRKAGATPQITGRMEEASAVLPANEAERSALARLLATRPVWLAADLPEAEENAVIEAHRAALRHTHRLLLIVVPQNPARAPILAEKMDKGEGWIIAQRSADEEPEAETEAYFADASEYGLWYRLAPISYLGGSLSGGGCLRDPLEAAALGSSIIHGPRTGIFGPIFGRLGAARATRSVASTQDLTDALADLLAPDRAARYAQAAWAVASDGVEVTDRVQSLLRKMMGED